MTSFFSARGLLTRFKPGEVPEARPATVAGRACSDGTLALGEFVVDIVRTRTGGRGDGIGCWVTVAALVTRDRTGVVVVEIVRIRGGDTTNVGLVLVVVAFLSATVKAVCEAVRRVVVFAASCCIVDLVAAELDGFAGVSPGLSFLCMHVKIRSSQLILQSTHLYTHMNDPLFLFADTDRLWWLIQEAEIQHEHLAMLSTRI